jgi:hypothetical protein
MGRVLGLQPVRRRTDPRRNPRPCPGPKYAVTHPKQLVEAIIAPTSKTSPPAETATPPAVGVVENPGQELESSP